MVCGLSRGYCLATCMDQPNDTYSHNISIDRLLEHCNANFVCSSRQPSSKHNRGDYGCSNFSPWQWQQWRQPGLGCRRRRRPHSRRSHHRRRRLVPYEAEREAESCSSNTYRGAAPIRVAQTQARLCGRDGQHRPDIRASGYGCATLRFGIAQVHYRLRRGPPQYLSSSFALPSRCGADFSWSMSGTGCLLIFICFFFGLFITNTPKRRRSWARQSEGSDKRLTIFSDESILWLELGLVFGIAGLLRRQEPLYQAFRALGKHVEAPRDTLYLEGKCLATGVIL